MKIKEIKKLENDKSTINVYLDNKNPKELILMKKKDIKILENNKSIINIYLNYLKKDNDEEILNILLDFIHNDQLYKYICKKNKEILKNLLKETKSEKGLKLLFYLNFSYDNVIYSDILNLKEKTKDLKNENEILSLMNEPKKIFSYDFSKLEEYYGTEANEIIENYIKLYVIHNILLNKFNGKNIISFEEFENEIGVKIEDVEDYLIEGNESGIFKVKICYNNKNLKVYFVKKPKFNKEDIQKLSEDISSIKNKIDITLKAVEQI